MKLDSLSDVNDQNFTQMSSWVIKSPSGLWCKTRAFQPSKKPLRSFPGSIGHWATKHLKPLLAWKSSFPLVNYTLKFFFKKYQNWCRYYFLNRYQDIPTDSIFSIMIFSIFLFCQYQYSSLETQSNNSFFNKANSIFRNFSSIRQTWSLSSKG